MFFDNTTDNLFNGVSSSNLSEDLSLEGSIFCDLNLFGGVSNSVEEFGEQELALPIQDVKNNNNNNNNKTENNEIKAESLQSYLEEMFSNFNPFDQDLENDLTIDFEEEIFSLNNHQEEEKNNFPELATQTNEEESSKIGDKKKTVTEQTKIKKENSKTTILIEKKRKNKKLNLTKKKATNKNPKISKKRVEKLKNKRRSERQKKLLIKKLEQKQTPSKKSMDLPDKNGNLKNGKIDIKENEKPLKLANVASRKREINEDSNKPNCILVESGKEVFKLLTGQLWICIGGSSQKQISPYTNVFADKIGVVLGLTESQIKGLKSQLKYLLSNSRRTFTEYILEILLGIVSLSLNENKKTVPGVVNRFMKLMVQISRSQKKKSREFNKIQKGINNSKTKTKKKIAKK